MENVWFLEAIAADGSRLVHEIDRLPFRVGRDTASDLSVQALGLSRRHAEFTEDVTGRVRLADLDSTNGTYVNRVRINGSQLLSEGDVIHFGNAEFRLRQRTPDSSFAARTGDTERTVLVPGGPALSQHFVPLERQFRELLSGQGLSAAIQPIVDVDSGAIYAYELLGRGTHPALPQSPVRLFHLAAQLESEVELSRAFRDYGLRTVATRLRDATVFVNAHPRETFEEDFLAALREISQSPLAPQVVVEVHETAVTEVPRMRELAARLKAIGVRFAYDDFGAGQARLNELGEVPAHFVKFDMGLIRGIDSASERKQRVVSDLVRLVLDLGSVPLAEGVETVPEARVCRQMGFKLLQGFLTGRPMPLGEE